MLLFCTQRRRVYSETSNHPHIHHPLLRNGTAVVPTHRAMTAATVVKKSTKEVYDYT